MDARQNREVRDRAQTVLEKMADCGFICTLGLYGDLSAAVAGFLRLFDVEWHDPAKTIKQKKAFIQQLPGRNYNAYVIPCHLKTLSLQTFAAQLLNQRLVHRPVAGV